MYSGMDFSFILLLSSLENGHPLPGITYLKKKVNEYLEHSCMTYEYVVGLTIERTWLNSLNLVGRFVIVADG